MIAVDTAVGVEMVLPGWAVIATAAVTFVVTAYAAAQILRKIVVDPTQRTVVLLRNEVRSWMQTTDLVAENAPKWDKGLSELAKAVDKLAEVTQTLGNLQGDLAMVKEQVTIDHGESLKDRVITLGERGIERHARINQRLSGLEAHLRRQDAAHGDELDALDDHLDRQDDRHDVAHPDDEQS